MSTPPLPHRHRCPWFLSGVALGLLLGAWCIHTGLESARTSSPRPAIAARP